ncbi:hypothetical protein EZV62_011518 [Acer yangbiense]|uniref:Uncharacterized protein n=1 Tax=Acer yangbiense TaxID=1000413 RepID=A0A5C7I5X9_9ROSI|nr:hypothetical protein EZV62_011518 [Acer yangbiense]
MKYVRPLTLYRELLKKNRALLKATEEPHSINLNLLKKYVNLEYPENLMALADRSLELSKKPPQMYRLVAFNIIRDGITFSVPGYPDNKEAFFLKFHPYAVRGIEAPYLKATLERFILSYNLMGFVVGYPCNNKKENLNRAQVRKFMDDMCKDKRFEDLKYTFWDSKFASKVGELMSNFSDVPQYAHKRIIDMYSAVGILQDYLDFANKKTLELCKEEDGVGIN